ncbi:MAG TPA: hypothetical protein VFE42_33200 [Chloroflexota bacterium]|nr:hypothetical protein [Chloroflexota bacterium]
MSLLNRLFNRPKRPADGSVCPACGSPMILDSRVIRPRIGVEITQEYYHCINRECGHTIPRPGESLTLPYLYPVEER